MCFSSLKRCQSCANTQILEQEIGAPSPKLALCSGGPCKYPRAEAHPIDREQVGKFEQGRSSTCRVTGYVDLRVSNIVSVREEHDSRSAIISWLNCRCLLGVGYYDGRSFSPGSSGWINTTVELRGRFVTYVTQGCGTLQGGGAATYTLHHIPHALPNINNLTHSDLMMQLKKARPFFFFFCMF